MEHPEDYERTDTNSFYITIFAIVCIISVIGSIFVLDFYFDYVKQQVKDEAQPAEEKAEINTLKKEQNAVLEGSITVDTEDGQKTTKPISEAIKDYSEEDLKKRK